MKMAVVMPVVTRPFRGIYNTILKDKRSEKKKKEELKQGSSRRKALIAGGVGTTGVEELTPLDARIPRKQRAPKS